MTQSDIITDRLLDFAAGSIKLDAKLGKTVAGRYLSNQLMRASVSAGANYQEARGAENRPYFVHKMQVVLKELREAWYWVRLIERANLLTAAELWRQLGEADELTRIVARSVTTAKARLK